MYQGVNTHGNAVKDAKKWRHFDRVHQQCAQNLQHGSSPSHSHIQQERWYALSPSPGTTVQFGHPDQALKSQAPDSVPFCRVGWKHNPRPPQDVYCESDER